MTIKRAAWLARIPYENAKLINKVYKFDGRAHRLNRIGKGAEAAEDSSQSKLLRDDGLQSNDSPSRSHLI